MAMKKKAPILTAAVLSASLAGAAGIVSQDQGSAAERVDDSAAGQTEQDSKDTLQAIYTQAFKGKMPYTAEKLKIGVNTRGDVLDTFGPPPNPGETGVFDYYHAEMGHPGFAFAYDSEGVINQIRYFGTNVEREHNLGSVTPEMLSKELGQADKILQVTYTGETDYVYLTDNYELHFVIRADGTTEHVNLVQAK